VGALLRRAYQFQGGQPALELMGAVLDMGQSALVYGDERLELTRNENRILQTLLEGRGNIVSRDALMDRLWDSNCFVDDNTLTVNIARLRKKLEGIGLMDFIVTQRGEGYRTQAP
jgi:DNA-binding response OmpR family regulator